MSQEEKDKEGEKTAEEVSEKPVKEAGEKMKELLKKVEYWDCVKSAAYRVLNEVCRIPTHMFDFIQYGEIISKAGGTKSTGSPAVSTRARVQLGTFSPAVGGVLLEL